MNRGARWKAKQAGETKYAGGKPCGQCGGLEKYTAAAKCVPCMHKKNAEVRREKYAADPEAVRAKLRAAWAATPIEKRRRWARDSRLRNTYGIEPEQFSEMLQAQEGGCAICYEAFCYLNSPGVGGTTRPVIDHDHATGKVRGLLCDRCNHALGHLRDSPELARRAGLYLEGKRKYD